MVLSAPRYQSSRALNMRADGYSGKLGRCKPPLIVMYGRFVFLTPKKLERAEHWLARYEAGGIFFARLLPVVRHLISIPAGIVRMNFALFSVMTTVGSFLWCLILAKF